MSVSASAGDYNKFCCPNLKVKSNFYLPGVICRFVKDHPKVIKVVTVAATILGSAAILSAPSLAFFSVINNGTATYLGVSGTLVAGSAYLGHKLFEYTLGFSYEMTNHAYVEDGIWVKTSLELPGNKKVTGKSKLTYEGDIPLFSIQAEDHYSSGYIQGTRLAPQIHATYEKLKPIFSILTKFNSFPNSKEEDPRFKKLWKKIPSEYREEMDGLVKGYNRWAKANAKALMNQNDLLLFHFLPEIQHFTPSEDRFSHTKTSQKKHSFFERLIKELVSSGCTAVVTKDEHNRIHFGRNMDWLSHNVAGNSLLINRKIGNNRAFVDFTFPVCIGVITAMNEEGLSLSINVSAGKTETYRGTPAILNNRKFIEDCSSVEEVVTKANQLAYQPNGPCHTTLADTKTAGSLHFYQASKDRNGSLHYYEKKMSPPTIHVYEGLDPLFQKKEMSSVWEVNQTEKKEVVVANKGYKVTKEGFQPYNHHDSDERIENISAYLSHQGSRNRQAVIGAMKLPLVNNCATVHHLYLNPQNKLFYVAMDNNFSGDKRMQLVDLGKYFNH